MCALALLISLPLPLHAQQTTTIQYYRVESGTGFFVNRQYVITNAHVVKGCQEVYIKGAVPETKANVQVLDEANDLALIETDKSPQQFAPLRFNIDDLKAGDKVLLLGYPGVEGAGGKMSVATGQIVDMSSVDLSQQGFNKGKFFFSDVVQHGNSGGPVFDSSGNVIGVVVAISDMVITNPMTQQKVSEMHLGTAIDLATLKQFLFNHGVFTEWMGSVLHYDDSTIEDTAKGYVVNVQCRTLSDGPVSGVEQLPDSGPNYGR